ncbi:hypothetical protein A3A60_02910 [Candidatus Curtissbacteria bacterium RIFCSPLOWO2_01_FULL_42_26]|uniref:LTD domain-containing protein n=1 Tax=Candidatus Curtissbacteria bacterium RIFCSPLOWO2_01_FULL_42_26 TaxID=1797729 RepID=A0A1F5I2P0_9BACT|nr:MAG: hypothetical protein A3A60_02910 [Candidatus Curtissbacteria bacterium RIFCSPLOWO2_01_FULL_42_26]
MKKKFKTLKIVVLSLVLGLVANLAVPVFLNNSSQALGELDVVWDGVADGAPIFVVNNMLPGDTETRNVQANNGGSIARLVSVKGTRTGGIGSDPKLETVLDIVISESGVDLYGGTAGAKTVADFFADSLDDNGIMLSILSGNDSTSYDFTVTFPASAGNDFQAKSVIFDITIGVIVSENIVINEVYYQVDGDHGLDSPVDRGVGAGNVSAIISNNGAGSVNTIVIDIDNRCRIVQTNNSNIINNLGIDINTGGNSAGGNTGGNVDINSGSASANVKIANSVNQNNSAACKKPVQNHEWIELFNPTDEIVSLKNWTITDNSGIVRIIPGNRKLKPGQFALISRDNSTWRFWDEDPIAIKIPLGKQIGDGLDNGGDRLILSDAQGNLIDALSYGDDLSIFNPSVSLVTLGSSFERLVPGFDTNVAADFEERNPPTPGN